MNVLGPGAAYSGAAESADGRLGNADVGLPAEAESNADGRTFLLAEGFDRFGTTAVSLSEAAETSATRLAAIVSRGDRIDRLLSENRSRLQALVDRAS